METDLFRIYQGNNILSDGQPIVIITGVGGVQMKGQLRSEVFVFVQNKTKDFYWRHLYSHEYRNNNESIKIDLEFLMGYALETATVILNDHLRNKYAETKDQALTNQPYTLLEICPCPCPPTLYRFLRHGEYIDKIELSRKLTKSGELIKYLSRFDESPAIGMADF